MKLYTSEMNQQTYLLDEEYVFEAKAVSFNNVFFKNESTHEEYMNYIENEDNEYMSFYEYCKEYVDENEYCYMYSDYIEYYTERDIESFITRYPFYTEESDELCDTSCYFDACEENLVYEEEIDSFITVNEYSEELEFICSEEYTTGVMQVWYEADSDTYYEINKSYYVNTLPVLTGIITVDEIEERYCVEV